jgi:hypothetical protein
VLTSHFRCIVHPQDPVTLFDDRRDVAIDELAAVVMYDAGFDVLGRFKRRLQLDRHGFAV